MTPPQTLRHRKANGLCIDCGLPVCDADRPLKPRVRCAVCRFVLRESRQQALREGYCSMCRRAARRVGRSTCAACAKKAAAHHKKYVEGLHFNLRRGKVRTAEEFYRNKERVMAMADRGFGSMDPVKQRKIASSGGRAAHLKGVAHEWTSEEARNAGRKGGLKTHENRRRKALEASTSAA